MSHYNKNYFNWQKNVGNIGGILNKFKFEEYVNEDDILLDFGCGGGYLLSNFKNKNKIGIEINKHAHEECNKNGVTVYENFKEIAKNSIDTIISNHALEHVPFPLQSLNSLYSILKPGGKIIVVVPCEQRNESSFFYKKGDINQHLHTWCPMTLGNLFNLAGFDVIDSNILEHQWIPEYQNKYLDDNIHELCREYAKKNKNIQVRVIATKK